MTKAAIALASALLAGVFFGNAATHAESVPSTAERITAQVKSGLTGELGVLELSIPKAVRQWPAASSTRLRADWSRAPRLGWNSVKIVRTTSNAKATTSWIRVKLGQRAEVLVARRDLSAGRVITDADLKLERRILSRREGWRVPPSALLGSRVLADTTAGTMVSDDHVEAPAPIARGQAFRVAIRRGRLEVAASAILERSARLGEVSTFRMKATRKLMRARLTSADTAVALEAK